ncbi:MAG: signal peptide peptidase SppA [Bacteroidales bacterium]|nr:signal peptide peptidase SppA [Bacteroidales bacterium]
MKEFFKMFGAVLAGLCVWGIITSLFSFVFFIMILSSLSSDSKETEVKIYDNSVLKLDLSKPIGERSTTNYSKIYDTWSFDNLDVMGLDDIQSSLDAAAGDDKVTALYVNLSDVALPDFASAEAVRKMILNFRNTEKPVYAFADSYDNLSYYVATACEKIFMRKCGDFVLKGLCSENIYYKAALDKFGISAQVIRHGKFKSAVEPYMQEKMSDANRLQIQTYLNDIWGVIVDEISKARNISKDKIEKYADDLSLYSNDELCLSSGLLDGIIFENDFDKMIQEAAGQDTDSDFKPLSISDYCSLLDTPSTAKNIAVIYANGEITSEESSSEDVITSKSMVKAIDEAMNDNDIKAVVLRVNSPGGSAVEAEIIHNELKKLHEKKPIVVSMGGYAASGGYYIACPADLIFAEQTTITGSIGVFGLMLSPEKLLKNTLALNVETVSTNKHSGFGSGMRTLDSREVEVLQKSVEDIYSLFIGHVADGRKMTVAQVDSIGQGRVWTGISAQKIGLVDEIGGLWDAVAAAAELADIETYNIKELPEKKDEFSKLFSGLLEARSPEIKILNSIKRHNGVQCYLPPAKIY